MQKITFKTQILPKVRILCVICFLSLFSYLVLTLLLLLVVVCLIGWFCWCFEIRSPVAQADFKLTK